MGDVGLVQVVLANDNGIPADAYVNDFVVTLDSGSLAAAESGIFSAIEAFYNSISDTTNGIALHSWLGEQVSRASDACTLKLYDITGNLAVGDVHGSPIATQQWTLGAKSGSGSLPDETAICMTLRGVGWDTAQVSGPQESIPTPKSAINMGAPATHLGNTRPRQSRSGRLYIGPLMSSVTAGSPFPGSIGTTYQTSLTIIAQDLKDALAAVPGVGHWAVWSRKLAATHSVVRVEVDNEFDTQRRRGRKATVRLSNTLS